MPWRDMIEERLKFVLEAINQHRKLSFNELCDSYNISTKLAINGLIDIMKMEKMVLRIYQKDP